MSITSAIREIGPEQAQALLAKNTNNRKIVPTTVNKYVSEMRAGTWLLDGAPIRIAKDGTLLDGQHRLTAVVVSETTQKFVIVEGLEPETQGVMDTGRKRSLGDMLVMRGETNAMHLAALATVYYRWKHGVRGSRLFTTGSFTAANAATMSPSIPTLLDFIDENPDLRELIKPANAVARVTSALPRVAALMWKVLHDIDEEDAQHFFARLLDGARMEPNDPILVLRNKLIEFGMDAQSRGHRVSAEYGLALIIKAWNAYRDGREVTRLYFKPGGANPEPFPEPR